ncbi:MAG TPA: PLDc N-terminal domain-containing protein [Flavisolibacter sp.]
MKSTRHPNFILAIISAVVLFFGIGLRANGYQGGDYVIAAGALLAGVHWIWAIIDVIGRKEFKTYQRMFWMIAVIAVPVFGAMLFYTMHQERGKIVT